MVRQIVRDTMFLMRKSQPATKADLPIAKDLADTLMAYQEDCVGLAANMIGHSKSIIAISLGGIPVVMMNPRLCAHSQEQYETEEGCLSLTGVRSVKRYRWIEVSYQDMMLRPCKATYHDYVAEIIQHEIDHCNGILI